MASYSYPHELQRSFESDIVDGVLAPGQTFSTSDLARRYVADRADLASVLSGAQRKGLIAKAAADACVIRGKGKPSVESVFQHARKSGLAPKSIVRAVEIVPAGAEVARKLEVPEGEPVFLQTRTRVVNDEVVANQNNYVPIEVCPGLESVDLSRTSFQEVLEGRFHAVVARIEEKFEVRPASEQDREVLALDPGAGVLVVERLSLSSNGMPLVWADIHVRTDRYHYVKELWPEAARVLQAERGRS
jgi:GntR family transcriptional regulator